MSMMATGAGMGSRGTPSIQRGKSKGGLTPYSMQQFTPEQMQLFQQSFGHVGPESFLNKLAGGDQAQFEQLEAPALKQFSALQGNMASRFSGMGSGARRSSGFQNSMNQAGSDFAQQLQSQRMSLQQQAISDLMRMSGDLMRQNPYENFLMEKPKKTNWFQSILGGSMPIAGGVLGGMYGGAPGAKLGASIGGAASKGFFG